MRSAVASLRNENIKQWTLSPGKSERKGDEPAAHVHLQQNLDQILLQLSVHRFETRHGRRSVQLLARSNRRYKYSSPLLQPVPLSERLGYFGRYDLATECAVGFSGGGIVQIVHENGQCRLMSLELGTINKKKKGSNVNLAYFSLRRAIVVVSELGGRRPAMQLGDVIELFAELVVVE